MVEFCKGGCFGVIDRRSLEMAHACHVLRSACDHEVSPIRGHEINDRLGGPSMAPPNLFQSHINLP